jgi:multidrug efflux system membrane fusion protein
MQRQRMIKSGVWIALSAGLVVAGFVYMGGSSKVGAQMPGGPQGPMPVVVNIMQKEPLMVWSDFSGRLTPVDYAVIQPQVSGIITEVRFEDGQRVEKGDVLMVIDPRPFDAVLKEAKANASSAENVYSLAKIELARAEGLMATNAISQRIFEERQTAAKTAQAGADSARAQVQQAQINLDYAYVKAPISGRAGRAELTIGNVVQAGPGAPILTSVVSDAGIYADFEVDEQTYLKTIRIGATDKAAEQAIPVQLLLGSEGTVMIEGQIHTFDNRIDPTSGTIRARALFENADGVLLPGMFVKVLLGSPSSDEKIMITEKAIGTDQNRKFVYVVDDKNTTQYRQIELGASMGGRRVVLSGLEPGEKVIVEGVMRIQPGMPVQPMSAEEMEAMMKAQEEVAKAAQGGPPAQKEGAH